MASSRPVARPIDLSGRTVAELRDLRSRVDALIVAAAPRDGTTPEVPVPAPTAPVEAVLDAAFRHLRERRTEGDGAPPLSVFRKQAWWGAARSQATVVSGWIERNAPAVHKNLRHRRHAYYVVVGVLIRWLESVRVPVTPRTVALNLDKVPAVMDRQFPGYALNGLLEWVFRAARAGPSRREGS